MDPKSPKNQDQTTDQNPQKDNNNNDNNSNDNNNNHKFINPNYNTLIHLNDKEIPKYFSIFDKLYYTFYHMETLDIHDYTYSKETKQLWKKIIDNCQKCAFFFNCRYFANEAVALYNNIEIYKKLSLIIDHCLNPGNFQGLKHFLLNVFTYHYFDNDKSTSFLKPLLDKQIGMTIATKDFYYTMAQEFIDIVETNRYELVDEVDGEELRETIIITKLSVYFTRFNEEILPYLPRPIIDRISTFRKSGGYRFNNIRQYNFDRVTEKYWYFDDPENIVLMNNNETIKLNNQIKNQNNVDNSINNNNIGHNISNTTDKNDKNNDIENNINVDHNIANTTDNKNNNKENPKTSTNIVTNDSSENQNNKENSNKPIWSYNETKLLIEGFYMFGEKWSKIKNYFFSSENNSGNLRSEDEISLQIKKYIKIFPDSNQMITCFLSMIDKEWCDNHLREIERKEEKEKKKERKQEQERKKEREREKERKNENENENENESENENENEKENENENDKANDKENLKNKPLLSKEETDFVKEFNYENDSLESEIKKFREKEKEKKHTDNSTTNPPSKQTNISKNPHVPKREHSQSPVIDISSGSEDEKKEKKKKNISEKNSATSSNNKKKESKREYIDADNFDNGESEEEREREKERERKKLRFLQREEEKKTLEKKNINNKD
ncbi:hypothetical protein DICPUDRAFT_99058 [Dictyostelium purpureum]|uniref:Myb-like domain-containing protein n=1 Tax=Dictyostelium purpureum TaxID=5786 RepID=F0ZVT9_DICPU|nr:uncharacterized protein DICPUDRAFT_99058 [Dictyostelium purpureum]EGC31929.1 hypothetical protein DICPUDRAFT_99058 [Dictyostelium purpureum]|eukprot:XP_003291531.1 hypothetical protein DICPUDRAFT_99058 [Dictyostelium purpureum]